MKNALMTVSCPHCSSAWWLPVRLLGPGGARVRCPGCEHRFEVAAAASVVAGASVSEAPDRGSPPVGTVAFTRPALRVVSPEDEALSTLAAQSVRLADAASRGQLFAEFGAEILDAFERFMHARPDADAEYFHRALSARCGITLPPPATSATESRS